VPGVDVADLATNQWAVSPRGVHGLVTNLTLVLVDGRQLFDSIFGGTLWGSWPFQVEDIERIEVIRGPAGVAWGSNAMNGVINIITKDPADQQGVTIRAGGGSRGTQTEHLGYGVVDGKLRLRVSGEYHADDGFDKGGSILRSLDDGVKAGRETVYAIYEAGPKDSLSFSAGDAVADGGFPPPPTAGLFGASHSSSQANFVLSKWTHRIEQDNTLQLTSFVNDCQSSSGLKSVDYRYQQYAFQVNHTFKPREEHTLSWGIDTRGDDADASGADPHMLRKSRVQTGVFGVYAQEEWQFAPRWTFDIGGRVDYDTYGGFQPSGRISLSHQITSNTSLWGAISRAFHMPPGAMRYFSTPVLDGLAGMDVNPDVTPETMIAYEVGVRGRYFDKLDLNGNLFWNADQDAWTNRPKLGPPGLFHFEWDNRASPDMYGVELDAKYALTKSLSLLGNYTYQQLNWGADGGMWQMDCLTPPKHKFMVGARYDPISDLHLSSYLYYVDCVHAPNPSFPLLAEGIDPYFRLDLRAEYEFWKKTASVSVGVRNLLDGEHKEGTSLFLNDAEVPRMIYAELRLTVK
jgi:iron complex outermembrane recepter protein